MNEMFGLSMNTIMIVLLALLAATLSVVLLVFVRNRLVFLMGLRNIPRRTAQTVLIVLGLMLSTVIITAAFTTGDTVDYSITKTTYDQLGHADVLLDGEVGSAGDQGQDTNDIPGAEYERFLNAADSAGLENVDGYVGVLYEPVPAINQRTLLSEPNISFAGADTSRLDGFPDVRDVESGNVLSVEDLGPDEVYLNESASDELEAQTGDALQVFIRNEPHEFTVRAIVEDTGLTGTINTAEPQGMTTSLERLHELFGHDEVTLIVVSATGGVRTDLEVVGQAEGEVNGLIEDNQLRLEVSDTKKDFVEEAEEIANFMTTFFLVLGLFSIAAGMLLIVMIFVMLAAERKPEMGMARAVGMKRLHLMEMFVAEGEAYNLGAALVGVVAGILVAFALTSAASAIFSTFGLTFTPHVTLRTAAISFSLGAVLTFLTVSFSSWRISNLNIVAAIRDTDEAHPPNPEAGTFRGYVRSLMNAIVALVVLPFGPLLYAVRGSNFAESKDARYEQSRQPWFPLPLGIVAFPWYQAAMLITNGRPVPIWPFYLVAVSQVALVAGVIADWGVNVAIYSFAAAAAIVIAYLLVLLLFRLVRDRRPDDLSTPVMFLGALLPFPVGVVLSALQDPERRIVWGPGVWSVLSVLGALLVLAGMSGDAAFPFALGFSLFLGGLAVVAAYFGAPARPTYTTMGILLLLFWGFTAGNRLEWLFGTLDGDIEMFFLSGVAMVTASTFVLIYNADIFLAGAERIGGAFGSILPSLRTAIAYPMANRFRTGMTLAMISLVVFALTTMSAMNLNYDKLFLQEESRGGWDVQVIENPNNPLTSVREVLEQAGDPVANDVRVEGAVLVEGFESATEVSQDGEEYDDYPVRGLSDGFVDNSSVPLDLIAAGYEDEEAVWDELKQNPDAAVIDRFPIESGLGPGEFSVEGIDPDADSYDPITLTVRDATTGASRDVQIIGVIAFGASSNFLGIYLGEEAFLETFGEPELRVHYVAVENPGRAKNVANAIESALVATGAQAESLEEIAAEQNALSRNFLYLMQAFMGLGLIVGIAAVGVIAFRTVVERRQQIGMLRAIGYKKAQVSLSFLMESSFVTVLGVTSGNILGLWLAYFLVTSDDFPGDGNTFYIPWIEITFISILTVVASLLMTLIPSRQAASVPTAEALRYE